MKPDDPQMPPLSADFGKEINPPKHLRNSATSADPSAPLDPREIEVHIEELVLHGFDPHSRWQVADAVQSELRTLLSAHGLPAAWQANAASLQGGNIRLTDSPKSGNHIAMAVYGGDLQ